MNFSIVTYGGGEQLSLIFNSIAMLFHDHGSVMNIMTLTLSLSGVWLIFKVARENSMLSLMIWFASFFLILEVLVLPKTKIQIIDRAGGNHMYTVNNLPLGLALLASTTSSIGDTLTRAMEQVFSLPDDLKYQNTGLVFASQIMSNIKHLTITNDNFDHNFKRFVKQCVCYELFLERNYTLDDLQNSNDIWGLVSQHASNIRSFPFQAPYSKTELITCSEGVKRFNELWKKVLDDSMSFFGRKIFGFKDKNPQYNLIAKSEVMRHIPLSFDYLMGSEGNTAENVFKQQLMIHGVHDGIHEAAGRFDNYRITRTQSLQRANQETAGLMTLHMLPIFHTTLEAIAYALFIFVVILGALPGGTKIILSYIKLLVSLQLWAPLYAVLNLLISFYARSKTQGYLDGQGLTMMTSYGLANINRDIASYAGYLSLMIPAIAWSLTQGGTEAFGSLASSVLSSLQSNIAKATDEATSGNLSFDNKSIGNDSMHNTNSFKFNNTLGFDSGRFAIRHHSGAMLTTNPDGRSIIDAGVGSTASNLLQNVNLQGSIMSSLAESADQYETLAHNKMSSASFQEAQAMNSAIEFAEHIANSEASGKSWSESDSTGVGKSMNNMLQSVENFAKNNQLDTGKSARILAAASLASDQAAFGKILNNMFGISGRAEGSLDSSAYLKDIYQAAKNYDEKTSFQENMENALRSVKDDSFRTNDDQGQRYANNIRTSIDQAHSYREEASANLQKAESYRKAHSLTQSAGSSYGTNMNQAFYEWLQKDVGKDKADTMLSSSGYEVIPYVAEFAEQVSEGIVAEANQNFANSQANISNYDKVVSGIKSQYNNHDSSSVHNALEKIVGHKKNMRTVSSNIQQRVEDNIVKNDSTLANRESQAQIEYQKFANDVIAKEKASVVLEALKTPIVESVIRPAKQIANLTGELANKLKED